MDWTSHRPALGKLPFVGAVVAVTLAYGDGISAAQPVSSAQLVPEYDHVVAGEPAFVAVRLTMEPGWHTYWRNPGDAGAPTIIDWRLPTDFSAGPIIWPTPQRYETGPIISFGFDGDVWLLSEITVPEDVTPGATVSVRADIEWLVCSDICIPQYGSFAIDLPVLEAHAPKGANEQFERARARLPDVASDGASLSMGGEFVKMSIPLDQPPGSLGDTWVFPADDGIVDYQATPEARMEGETLLVSVRRAAHATGTPTAFSGVVTFDDGGVTRAVEFHATPEN
jgi:thiol:disulfide interchange protein DsbD